MLTLGCELSKVSLKALELERDRVRERAELEAKLEEGEQGAGARLSERKAKISPPVSWPRRQQQPSVVPSTSTTGGHTPHQHL